MFNFNLENDEELIEVFEHVWIKQTKNEKNTTIALTTKRLLFLDYVNQTDLQETLRIARGVEYVRTKEVYYKIELTKIKEINKKENYYIKLDDNSIIEFDESKLYELLKSEI